MYCKTEMLSLLQTFKLCISLKYKDWRIYYGNVLLLFRLNWNSTNFNLQERFALLENILAWSPKQETNKSQRHCSKSGTDLKQSAMPFTPRIKTEYRTGDDNLSEGGGSQAGSGQVLSRAQFYSVGFSIIKDQYKKVCCVQTHNQYYQYLY